MPDETNPPAAAATLEQLAERVDSSLAEAQKLEPEARRKALAVQGAIEAFHKAGLTKIVQRLKADPRGRELLFELAEEPQVYALFAMHGLVRADLRTRVSRVIEMVRPYMQSHGGDVALDDVREGRVFVRLSGSCNGCSMSAVTLRSTGEEALKEHVPEIAGVEVVPTEPALEAPVPSELVQIQLPAAAVAPADGWVAGPPVAEVVQQRPTAFLAGDTPVLLIHSRAGWRAFRNACAHQGLPLENGLIDHEADTITCPWHGFCFNSDSGECFSAPQCQLEQFPLQLSAGRFWVRPS